MCDSHLLNVDKQVWMNEKIYGNYWVFSMGYYVYIYVVQHEELEVTHR